jgi:hypothetical protein
VWNAVVLALIVLLTASVSLVVALRAGFNSPRPTARPAWQLTSPRVLQAVPPQRQAVQLLAQADGAFVLEAVAAPLGEASFNGYGLAFRAQGAGQYAVFAVGSDGYAAILAIDGAEETPLFTWRTFPHVRRGAQANRLRLACADGVCHFWINDEHLTHLPDDLGPAGGVGIWVRRYTAAPVRVTFDQVALWSKPP